MEMEKSQSLLEHLIHATAGNFTQYQLSFWGQLVLGFLYSFGFFDHWLVGLILGFIMPVLWIVLTYRYIRLKAKADQVIPFPAWMQKNPGNTLVIIIDIIFLGLIWIAILSGWYEPVWLKVLFTIIFPILSLSMLRNLIIFPFRNKEDEDFPDE